MQVILLHAVDRVLLVIDKNSIPPYTGTYYVDHMTKEATFSGLVPESFLDPITKELTVREGGVTNAADLSTSGEKWPRLQAIRATVPCSDDQCGATVLGNVMREMFPLDDPTPRIKPCAGCNRVEQLNTP